MAAWIHAEDRSRGRRSSQQDDYGIFELPINLASGDLLLVIADGMGSAQAGELAGFALVLVGFAAGWLYYRGKSL
jgi:serine/threonine protein phosphatase PrpC